MSVNASTADGAPPMVARFMSEPLALDTDRTGEQEASRLLRLTSEPVAALEIERVRKRFPNATFKSFVKPRSSYVMASKGSDRNIACDEFLVMTTESRAARAALRLQALREERDVGAPFVESQA